MEAEIDYFCKEFPELTRDEVEDVLDALALDDLYCNENHEAS